MNIHRFFLITFSSINSPLLYQYFFALNVVHVYSLYHFLFSSLLLSVCLAHHTIFLLIFRETSFMDLFMLYAPLYISRFWSRILIVIHEFHDEIVSTRRYSSFLLPSWNSYGWIFKKKCFNRYLMCEYFLRAQVLFNVFLSSSLWKRRRLKEK